MPGSLSPFQLEVLHGFFEKEGGFFLTGGGALVGFHLHHRHTDDLDLFTTSADAFERGKHVLAALASDLGAELQARVESAGFRRYALRRGADLVVVDTVLDRTPQVVADKPLVDGIAVDPPSEILVNKLAALVGRAEERDIIDVYELEKSGLRVDDALAPALRKDGGATPANLAWLLSQITIPDDAKLAGDVPPRELARYIDDLVARLRRLARP